MQTEFSDRFPPCACWMHNCSCVALAGVVTEYLRFGQAEGGMGDVMQLDSMFRALNVGSNIISILISDEPPPISFYCTSSWPLSPSGCFQILYHLFILQFTQLKADGEVRWAVLNIAAILKQYEALHLCLSLAMEAGKSIGELAEMIDVEVQSAPTLTSVPAM